MWWKKATVIRWSGINWNWEKQNVVWKFRFHFRLNPENASLHSVFICLFSIWHTFVVVSFLVSMFVFIPRNTKKSPHRFDLAARRKKCPHSKAILRPKWCDDLVILAETAFEDEGGKLYILENSPCSAQEHLVNGCNLVVQWKWTIVYGSTKEMQSVLTSHISFQSNP